MARFDSNTIIRVVNAMPTTSNPVGFYSLQTGDDKGLYFVNGDDVYLVIPYAANGTYPIARTIS